MKIIILSTCRPNELSGVGQVLTNLFPLLKEKIDVKWKICAGASFVEKRKHLHPFLKILLVGFLTFLKSLFDKDFWHCQIINAHGTYSWLPTIWLSKTLRKTSLISLHETYEYTKEYGFCGGEKLGRWFWFYALRNGNYFIDISKTLKGKNVFYTFNGIDLGKFRLQEIKKTQKIVLFVGRLSPQKGIEYFVKAAQIIKKELKEKIKFVVITNTLSIKGIKGKYADLIKKNKIELYRSISSNEIVKFYQKADVLILPSLSEAFGLVLLEAMACGTPVVASRVGGVPNVVKDGVVGFLVLPRNPQAIAQKTLKILTNEELRKKMRKNCLEWVKNFSWEKVAQQYLEIYKKIPQK